MVFIILYDSERSMQTKEAGNEDAKKQLSDVQTQWIGRHLTVSVLYSSAGIATQILAESKKTKLLLDVGDGTLRDLLHRSFDLNALDCILLSHGHFDHIGGLWPLLGFMRMIGRRRQLLALMPWGITEARSIIRAFISNYASTTPFSIRVLTAVPGRTTRIGDISINTFRVRHRGTVAGITHLPMIPAVGYGLTCRNERVVFSGDTGLCQSLEKEVKGADLAILEATRTRQSGAPGIHLLVDEARKLGKLAQNYILVHRHQN